MATVPEVHCKSYTVLSIGFFIKSLLPPHTWRVEILWIATGGSLAVGNGWT